VFGFKAGHRRPGQLQGGQGKGRSRSGGGGLAQEAELCGGGGYGVSDGKNRDGGGVRLCFWQGKSLDDVADEALPLALRSRGPAGRLACRGAQRGSACSGAWPGGPLPSRSNVPRRGVRRPGHAESPGRARGP
jgi:hypothetical protein